MYPPKTAAEAAAIAAADTAAWFANRDEPIAYTDDDQPIYESDLIDEAEIAGWTSR